MACHKFSNIPDIPAKRHEKFSRFSDIHGNTTSICLSIRVQVTQRLSQIFDESLDACGQGRTQNAIITVHSSIKVAVDLNDPGKPDPGSVNEGYNEELDRPRPDYMDQLLELSVHSFRFCYF